MEPESATLQADSWPSESPGKSLGQEDPPEEGMATPSSTLARRIPWTEEPDGLQSMGSQRVGHSWATNTFIFMYIYSPPITSVSKVPGIWGERMLLVPPKSHVHLILFLKPSDPLQELWASQSLLDSSISLLRTVVSSEYRKLSRQELHLN